MSSKLMRLAVKYIVDEAAYRGIEVIKIDHDHFSLSHGNHTEYFDETVCSQTTALAVEFCFNKDITKIFLRKNNIQTPRGGWFSSLGDALHFFDSVSGPVVVKPCYGMEGNLVFSNVVDKEQLKYAWDSISKKYDQIVVEERFEGEEYRIFASIEGAWSVVKRIPANVVGDGVHSINELIEMKNQHPKRQPGLNPLAKIVADEVVLETLRSKSLSLESVPIVNERVFLRDNSNISTGGDSVECSHIAHPSVGKIATDAIRSIPGLLFGGVDFMTKDIRQDQVPGMYTIIEINSQPGLALHHEPFEGEPKNIAAKILDLVFPETKKELVIGQHA